MDLERQVGLRADGQVALLDRRGMGRAIALKLAAMGFRVPEGAGDVELLDLGRDLFARYREQSRLLSDHLCPADRRIQAFLDSLFVGLSLPNAVRLPGATFLLDRYGIARELSLPDQKDEWHNEVISSYRLDNGVLHNPAERPADDARRVPRGRDRLAGARRQGRHSADRLRAHVAPRAEPPVVSDALALHRGLGRAGRDHGLAAAAPAGLPARCRTCRPRSDWRCASSRRAGWCPTSISSRASSATRAIRILPENDAGLDVDHWTGHTGCVILAPHLTRLKKKDLGLPHISRGHRQRRSATACAGPIRRRDLQQRQRVQNHRSQHGRRDGHDHCRQLLRLLQERGEDPDQLQREPVRPGRGRTRWRRAGLRDAEPRRSISRRTALASLGPPLRGSARVARRSSRSPRQRLRHRQAVSRDPLPARGHGDRPRKAGRAAGPAAAENSTSNSCQATSTSIPAATRCGWKSTRQRRAGV